MTTEPFTSFRAAMARHEKLPALLTIAAAPSGDGAVVIRSATPEPNGALDQARLLERYVTEHDLRVSVLMAGAESGVRALTASAVLTAVLDEVRSRDLRWVAFSRLDRVSRRPATAIEFMRELHSSAVDLHVAR